MRKLFAAIGLTMLLAACSTVGNTGTTNPPVYYDSSVIQECKHTVDSIVTEASRAGWFIYEVNPEGVQRWLNIFNNTGEPSDIQGESVHLLSPAQNVPYVFLIVGDSNGCVYLYEGHVPRVGKGFIAQVMQFYNNPS